MENRRDMAAEKYPIGIQTFEKIISGGFTYVDKTRFVEKLVSKEGYYFLSRPRRFGKSLLLSTLHAYFDGKRELFKGLHLYDADVEWTSRPVFHFDFNAEDYLNPDGLSLILDRYLTKYERIYGVESNTSSVSGRFASLIETAYRKTGQEVAILIDEYDKPLLGIEDNPEIFTKNQGMLKAFFGTLKTLDRHIRFAMLTGVARFNKVSIFSDVNNLHDISLSNEFADICGWTEEELLASFSLGIKNLALVRDESVESTITALRSYYDGYLFAEKGHKLYNPYSVLSALYDRKIRPYWFATGTPTFLVKRVVSGRIVIDSLSNRFCNEEELLQVGFQSSDPIPLMFQTGYLTISSYDPDRERYHLAFPNKEVEIGFAKSLYRRYVKGAEGSDRPFSIYKFQDDLYDGYPEQFMRRLKTLCKESGYESHSEDNYRNIVWLLCTLCGTDAYTEPHSYKGRSDLEVRTGDHIYIFEFKYNSSVESAMKQLREKDYAGRYALDPRRIYLIGANFSTSRTDRGLTGWQIEELNRL